MRIEDMVLTKRAEREFLAHTKLDVLADSYFIKNRFSHIYNYPSLKRIRDRLANCLQDIAGQKILDYGCGRGYESLTYMKHGAIVHGIDISPVYIEDAHRSAKIAGFNKRQFSFHVMDAHSLRFKDCEFDLVIGCGILHHLDIDIALGEIHRVLKPYGRVLLQEPLLDNPLLKLFRRLTPYARTKDERPLSGDDIHSIEGLKQWRSDMMYCGFLEAPIATITSVLIPEFPDNCIIRFADKIEVWTHTHRVMLPWNQYVLIDLVKT